MVVKQKREKVQNPQVRIGSSLKWIEEHCQVTGVAKQGISLEFGEGDVEVIPLRKFVKLAKQGAIVGKRLKIA